MTTATASVRIDHHAGLEPVPPRSSIPVNANAFRDREQAALMRFIGWFALGRGVAQLVAPRAAAEVAGIRPDDVAVRAMGVREIVTGLGVLTSARPKDWMWARVISDWMDLAYLGNEFVADGTQRAHLAGTGALLTGLTAMEMFSGSQLSSLPARSLANDERGIHVIASITVNATADELYRFWRNLENLPRILRHVQSVMPIEGNRSRWTATGPAGLPITWDAELTEDVLSERIAWVAADNAIVTSAGTVSFRRAAGGRGTVLDVDLRYEPIGGACGALLAFLFGKEPHQQITEDLRAYKAFVETGEVPTIRGQVSGRGID
jgi:uncharacterized membrane protein